MRLFKPKLWLHLILVIAMMALVVTGCDEDEDTEEETPTPVATEMATATPEPTEGAQATETPSPTATVETQATETPSPTETETAAYPDEPPPLPPDFGIDFGAFSESEEESFLPGWNIQYASYSPEGSSAPIQQAAWGDQSYYTHAAASVLIWSIIGIVSLAVPVATFAASFHNIPLQQPDGSWIWSYSVLISGVVHTAELHGAYIPEGARWDMYITKQGHYTDFHWYYGESDLPATEGWWIMQESPTNPTDLLRIDWTRNMPLDGTGTIKYTNIVPGGPENGGYIYTETNNETPYNAKWDIYNKGADNHTLIEWHRTTQVGRVQDFNRFADNEWHCWGTDHKNTECP